MHRYGIALDSDMTVTLDTRYPTAKRARAAIVAMAEPEAFVVRFDLKDRPSRVGRESMVRCIGLSGEIDTISWSEALKVYKAVRDIADTLPVPPEAYNGDRVRYAYETAGVSTGVYYTLVKRLAEREAYAEAHKFDRIEAAFDAQWDTYDTEVAAAKAMAERVKQCIADGKPVPPNALDVMVAGRDAIKPECPSHEAYARIWYRGEGHTLPDVNATRMRPPVDPMIGRGTPIRCGEKRRERLKRQAAEAARRRAQRQADIERHIGLRNCEYFLRRARLATVPHVPRMPHIAVLQGMIPQI